jgi:hypothetical protein
MCGSVTIGPRRSPSVVIRTCAFVWLAIAMCPARTAAQTISSELDVTAGYSGEEIRAAASQLRVFGEAPAGFGFFAEAAWGDRWSGDAPVVGGGLIGVDPMGSDVFGAAYPYSGRVIVMEAYAERYFTPGGALLGVRAGRFRTPFGIYSRSDYGYTGFVRPPLIRYDGYFAVSNNWLEDGVTVTAGKPRLSSRRASAGRTMLVLPAGGKARTVRSGCRGIGGRLCSV